MLQHWLQHLQQSLSCRITLIKSETKKKNQKKKKKTSGMASIVVGGVADVASIVVVGIVMVGVN